MESLDWTLPVLFKGETGQAFSCPPWDTASQNHPKLFFSWWQGNHMHAMMSLSSGYLVMYVEVKCQDSLLKISICHL